MMNNPLDLGVLFPSRDGVGQIKEVERAGIYAVFARRLDCLGDIVIPPSQVVYVGKARNLKQRNHFNAKHSGFHSPRRTFGAILREELALNPIPRSNGRSESNYKNFRFDEVGETRLTEWMRENLDYAFYPYEGDISELERSVIFRSEPPCNLTEWKNPQKQKIQRLRVVCANDAKSVWEAMRG